MASVEHKAKYKMSLFISYSVFSVYLVTFHHSAPGVIKNLKMGKCLHGMEMLQHKTTVLSTFNRNISVDLVAGVPLPGLLGYGGPEVVLQKVPSEYS